MRTRDIEKLINAGADLSQDVPADQQHRVAEIQEAAKVKAAAPPKSAGRTRGEKAAAGTAKRKQRTTKKAA